MQLARPNAIVSLTAAANLTGCVGRFVTLSSGSVTLISSELATPFGVLLSDGKAGQKVSVAVAAGGLSGTVRVKLSAAVAAPGTLLQLTNTGTVIPNNTATAARVVCGLALEAGQIGELIESVMFNPLVYPYASGGGGAALNGNAGEDFYAATFYGDGSQLTDVAYADYADYADSARYAEETGPVNYANEAGQASGLYGVFGGTFLPSGGGWHANGLITADEFSGDGSGLTAVIADTVAAVAAMPAFTFGGVDYFPHAASGTLTFTTTTTG